MNIGGLLLTVVFIVWDNNGALWQRGSMYIYIFGIDTHTVPAGGYIGGWGLSERLCLTSSAPFLIAFNFTDGIFPTRRGLMPRRCCWQKGISMVPSSSEIVKVSRGSAPSRVSSKHVTLETEALKKLSSKQCLCPF